MQTETNIRLILNAPDDMSIGTLLNTLRSYFENSFQIDNIKVDSIESLDTVVRLYNNDMINAISQWNFDNDFLIIAPSQVLELSKNTELYALDLRDGSEFLLDGDADEMQGTINSGDFAFGLENRKYETSQNLLYLPSVKQFIDQRNGDTYHTYEPYATSKCSPRLCDEPVNLQKVEIIEWFDSLSYRDGKVVYEIIDRLKLNTIARKVN